MSDLVAFLNARLDEDEAAAKAAAGLQLDPENGWGIDGRAITPHIAVVHEAEARTHIARHDPARVLREVEAKRKILAFDAACDDEMCSWHGPEYHSLLHGVLRKLAAVWSDHPDYQQEWA